MMTTPIIVETNLKEVLTQITQRFDKLDQKLDKLDERLQKVEIDVATVKTKLDGMDNRLENLEGNQSKQIWALIGILFTAVVATAIRFVIMAFPTA